MFISTPNQTVILGIAAAVLTLLSSVHECRADEPAKAPPLPFYTLDGVGGGAITPMAYLINPGPEGTTIGKPTVSSSYVRAGNKDILAVHATVTLLRRIELGYTYQRFDLGTFPDAVEKATTIELGGRDHTEQHIINLRGMIFEEGKLHDWMPAVTAGAAFKFNEGIEDLDSRLGGVLTALGLDDDFSVDFTVTATKMFPDVFGRPLIASAGVRFSEAAHIGLLGFGDEYNATFEGHLAYLATDWLALAYEYRQKNDPYSSLSGLYEQEDDWHLLTIGLIPNEHMTIVLAWGILGDMANSKENGAWAVQVKWEF